MDNNEKDIISESGNADNKNINTDIGADQKIPQNPVKKAKEELYCEKIHPVNHKFAAVAIAVFMVVLILPSVVWGVLSIFDSFSPGIMETLNIDLDEQRELAEFPEKFDPASITADIEAYYNDHVPFRSVIISAQRKLDYAVEQPYRDFIRPALIELFYSDYGSATPGGDDEGGSVGDFGDMFGNQTEPEETTEAETLPEFETVDGGDENCDHGLDDGETEKEATCTEWGVLLKTCQKCGYKVREYTAKAEHRYEKISGRDATCTENGYIEYKCAVCGGTYRETLRSEGHKGKFVRKVEPTIYDFGYSVYRCEKCNTEYKADFVDKLVDPNYFPLENRGAATIGRNNWLFYNGDDSLSYYQGSNLMSDSQMAEWLRVMEQLQQICDEKGIQLQFMLMPNKEIVYSEFMPTLEVKNTYRRSQRVLDYVNKNSDVNFIYPLQELLAAKPHWQVYYKHDTHWNSAGAFIGTQALYSALGMPTTNLLNLQYSEQTRVGGDLISLGGLSTSYGRDTEYRIPYRADVNVLSSDGDRQGSGTLHTTSDSANDKHFVMLSDSFRISMIPFLERDFAECTITHRENIGKSGDVNAAIKDADILVISAVERYDYQMIDAARKCIEILSE